MRRVALLASLLLLAAAAAAFAAGGSTPRCFGAASRDAEVPCSNERLRTMVKPTPAQARAAANAPCETVEPYEPPFPCLFGVSPEDARGSIALVGDSHAAAWRGAVDRVARARRWHGVSLTSSGCPLTAATIVASPERQAGCRRVIDGIVRWLGGRPDITTVFVVDHGSRVVPAEGQRPYDAQVEGFRAAWRSLPESVKRVVVIRDNPWSSKTTAACIDRAIAARRDAGRACALSRRRALRTDPQFDAARGEGPRVRRVDLTRLMCDRTRCFPVVGGALVHKDLGHITAAFATTMGPALGRAVKRLGI